MSERLLSDSVTSSISQCPTDLHISSKLYDLPLGEPSFEESHFIEWNERSKISAELTLLNLQSLSDETEIANRLGWKSYHHGSGWFIGGLSLDGKSYINGQFKADVAPVIDGKEAKYISTKTHATSPLLSRIGAETWRSIAINYNVPILDSDVDLEALDGGFWTWFLKHKHIPLTLPEGGKKSLSVLSQGKVAVALLGVDNWHDKGTRNVDNILAELCKERLVFIAYDMDYKGKERVKAAREEITTALTPIAKQICTLEWSEGKGIDDFIVKGGNLDEIISDAVRIQAAIDKSTLRFSPLVIHNETDTETIELAMKRRLENDYRVIDNAFYEYTGLGYWKLVADSVVNEVIQRILEDVREEIIIKDGSIMAVPIARYSGRTAKNCLETLRVAHKVTPPSNERLICFKNCTVDSISGEVQPHNPLDYLTWQVPYPFTTGLQEAPPIFKDFIDRTMGGDALEMVRAIFSMCLDPSAPYGRSVHLIGPSGSGKGTFLDLLANMFSSEAKSSINNINILCNPDKVYQFVAGKKILLVPDVKGFQKDVTNFYMLVQNEGVSARRLNTSETIHRKWNIRCILASTKPLAIEDSGDGWNRRTINIPFKEREGPQDYTLGSRLREETGLVASWALSMDKQRRNELLFTGLQTELAQELNHQVVITGDSIAEFLDRCIKVSSDTNKTIVPEELFLLYQNYCRITGNLSKKMVSFKMGLSELIHARHRVERQTIRKDGAVVKVPAHYKGLEIVPVFEPDGNLRPDYLKHLESHNLETFGRIRN